MSTKGLIGEKRRERLIRQQAVDGFGELAQAARQKDAVGDHIVFPHIAIATARLSAEQISDRAVAFGEVIQQRADSGLQCWKVFLCKQPNLFKQDFMIPMDEHITEAGIVAPRHFRTGLNHIRVQTLDSFANDHECKYDTILQQPVFKEFLATTASATFNMQDSLKYIP